LYHFTGHIGDCLTAKDVYKNERYNPYATKNNGCYGIGSVTIILWSPFGRLHDKELKIIEVHGLFFVAAGSVESCFAVQTPVIIGLTGCKAFNLLL
jgi:hypothetical protein